MPVKCGESGDEKVKISRGETMIEQHVL
jgi:hypothetical protein